MATPINSSNSAPNPLNGAGASPILSDLASRLNASANGGDSQGAQLAFSRWMEKHAAVGQDKPGVAQAPKPASAGTTASASNTASNTASARAAAKAAEQALARSRQQAMDAARPSGQAGTDAPVAQADKQARPKTEAQTSKPARKEGASKADGRDKSEEGDAVKAEPSEKDDVPFSTAMGEGNAMVRELTPPPTIQSGDAAGMMAWLASLTHGDLAQGKSGGKALAESSEQAAAAAGQGVDPNALDAALLDKQATPTAQTGIALDNPLWQSVSTSAALQVDALIAQSSQAGDSRTEGDPMAGLLASGGLKGATLGQGLEGASQVRHESATLATPLNSPDFAQALADQVSMWVGSTRSDGVMTAELHLNPAEMGPINVKIALDGQSAQVDFAAATLETRQAIEASMDKLSSALNEVGLSMTGGDVSSQTSQQAFEQGSGRPGSANGSNGRMAGAGGLGDGDGQPDAANMRAVAAPKPGRLGGLDLYA